LAANQFVTGQSVGLVASSSSPANTNLDLNAANRWLAFGFVPDQSKTLTKVRVFLSGVTGTLAATDFFCDIFSDNAGVPNATLTSGAGATIAVTASGWYEFTLSVALTAGVQYWAVLKNVNGTPASNFPTVFYTVNATSRPRAGSDSTKYGWAKNHTTDGTTWPNGGGVAAGYRIGFSDSSYLGAPIQTTGVDATNLIFGANEVGVSFTMPAAGAISVSGLGFVTFTPAGTPTGNLRFKLYTGPLSGPTLIDTTYAIPVANAKAIGQGWINAHFSTLRTLTPGTVVTVSMSNSAADSSANCYRAANYTWDSDANSLALLPFQGTALEVASTNTGASFSTVANKIIPFALLLDSASEFVNNGAGGSTPLSRIFTGF
jgi:hypothetical protein